jgi:hypothetical protein
VNPISFVVPLCNKLRMGVLGVLTLSPEMDVRN